MGSCQASARTWIGHVGLYAQHRTPACLDRRRAGLESIRASCREDHICAGFGHGEREAGTQAGARAGDDYDSAIQGEEIEQGVGHGVPLERVGGFSRRA